jgi:hypothetical protein
MPGPLQQFFATTTQKAADDLLTAFNRLPEDKRDWSPAESSRTAIDQLAECALLNGYCVGLLQGKSWPEGGFEAYVAEKKALLDQGPSAVADLLKKSTSDVVAAIGQVPDDTLDNEITLPWETITVAKCVSYPHWNICYHEGQINYIASILGCLD